MHPLPTDPEHFGDLGGTQEVIGHKIQSRVLTVA
jgi:hypothetical protein